MDSDGFEVAPPGKSFPDGWSVVGRPPESPPEITHIDIAAQTEFFALQDNMRTALNRKKAMQHRHAVELRIADDAIVKANNALMAFTQAHEGEAMTFARPE